MLFKMNKNDHPQFELHNLCKEIRQLIEEKKTRESLDSIEEAMMVWPHSPIPHNLMGILLEEAGDHALAMNHFLAANALDPTYLPAQRNLENFGSSGNRQKDFGDE